LKLCEPVTDTGNEGRIEIDRPPTGRFSVTSRANTRCCDTFCVSTSGAGARDGNRFRELSNREVGVHRRGEPRRQLDALTAECAEAGQRKRHRVGARSKVADFVDTLVVGDDIADLSINAGLAASTVTPGSTPPDVSRTTPPMVESAWQ
jgi:hypothetical protein